MAVIVSFILIIVLPALMTMTLPTKAVMHSIALVGSVSGLLALLALI